MSTAPQWLISVNHASKNVYCVSTCQPSSLRSSPFAGFTLLPPGSFPFAPPPLPRSASGKSNLHSLSPTTADLEDQGLGFRTVRHASCPLALNPSLVSECLTRCVTLNRWPRVSQPVSPPGLSDALPRCAPVSSPVEIRTLGPSFPLPTPIFQVHLGKLASPHQVQSQFYPLLRENYRLGPRRRPRHPRPYPGVTSPLGPR